MEKMLQQLFSLLQEQSGILKQMIEAAGQMTRKLADSELEGINAIVQLQQELNLKMDIIEKKRGKVVNEITAFFGINGGRAKLTEIIEKAEEPYKTDFKVQRVTIQKQLDEYKEIHELNLALIENNLSYVDFMINVISGSRETPVIYGAKGYAQQEEARRSFFDNKV